MGKKTPPKSNPPAEVAEENPKRIGIYAAVDPALKSRFKQWCVKNDTSITAEVVEMMREKLGEVTP